MIRELKIAILCLLSIITISLYLNTNTYKELVIKRNEELLVKSEKEIHRIKSDREKIQKGRHLLVEYSRSYAIFENIDTKEVVKITLDLSQYIKLASTREAEDSIFILIDGYLYKRANHLTQNTVTLNIPDHVSITDLPKDNNYYIHSLLLVKDTIIDLESNWGPYLNNGYRYSFKSKKEVAKVYKEFEIIHEVYLKLDEF